MKRLRISTHVSIGDPCEQILELARRCRSDLIVVGTQGLTGAHRFMLDSTTLGILKQTTIPVRAVPRLLPSGGDNELALWPGQQVLAAVELRRGSDRQVAIATAIAEWFGSCRLLTHVIGGMARPSCIGGDLSAHNRIRVAEAKRRLDALADVAARRVPTSASLICGHVADEIAALTSAERVGFVMIALRDKHGWLGSRRGSVSYHVLTHAVTPVLAYPPKCEMTQVMRRVVRRHVPEPESRNTVHL